MIRSHGSKNKFRTSKLLGEKYSHVYLHILYPRAQFCEKRSFLGLAKKIKKTCREKAYFSSEFCHFYIGHIKSQFFSQNHFVGTYDMEMNTQYFSFNIFHIF
jgi:hypothetical protein